MAYASDIRTSHTGLLDRLNAAFKAFSLARQQRRVYIRTLTELRSLDNRELADLGISASQIPFIAREAAYGTN